MDRKAAGVSAAASSVSTSVSSRKKGVKKLWKILEDVSSGWPYYYNRVTGETTWDRPSDDDLQLWCARGKVLSSENGEEDGEGLAHSGSRHTDSSIEDRSEPARVADGSISDNSEDVTISTQKQDDSKREVALKVKPADVERSRSAFFMAAQAHMSSWKDRDSDLEDGTRGATGSSNEENIENFGRDSTSVMSDVSSTERGVCNI
jgi:hypothetical protein